MAEDNSGIKTQDNTAAVENDHAPNGTTLEMEESVTPSVASPSITTTMESDTTGLVEKVQQRDLSNIRALVNLFRIMTGASLLGTGKIMENGGILLGPIGFILIGYLNAWCNVTIVTCSRILCKKFQRLSMTYEDIVEESFSLHRNTPRFTKLAYILKLVARTALVLCQLGLLSFYIKVIGTTIQSQGENYFSGWPLKLILTEFIVCVLLIPYSWMRNLKVLSWFSMMGNFILLTCVITVLQYMCRNTKDAARLPLVTDDIWTIPLFVGSTVFTVEGIPMIIPLENRVHNPDAYGGLCGLITVSATFNIALNVAVGFYSYLSVGQDISGNVLIHLPSTWVYSSMNVAVAVLVFLTYTLQLYMPAETLTAVLEDRFKSNFIQKHGSALTRTLLVIVSYLIAAVVPKVDLLMSLIGAFTSIVLVFGFPPLCELLVLHKIEGYVPWSKVIKDTLLLIFGAVFFVMGTYTSLRDIVAEF